MRAAGGAGAAAGRCASERDASVDARQSVVTESSIRLQQYSLYSARGYWEFGILVWCPYNPWLASGSP